MGLAAGLAIASGVKALGSFAYNKYKNNKRKKFGDSSLGKELKRIGEEGKFSQKAKGLIQGGANRASANVAQTGKASFAGRLASRGLEGSVAGQRGLNEFDIERQRAVAETGREVELANEGSKVEAKLSFAERKLADEREREGLERANVNQLIGGLGEAPSLGVKAYYGDMATKRRVDAFKNVDNIGALQDAVANNDITQQDFLTIIYLKRLDEQQGGGFINNSGGGEYAPFGSTAVRP